MADRRKLNKPADDDKRSGEDRRLEENEAFARAKSITAEVAPHRVEGTKVRDSHLDDAQNARSVIKKAIERKDEFIEKMPTLFELMGTMLEPKEREEYSYQADLYDALPKFVWAPVKREHGKYLPNLERVFEHSGKEFHMEMTPARVDGKDHYPGTREELIEMELVQMACDKGLPTGIGLYGVKFSLYELRKRLQDKGHTFSIVEIKQGLYIMNGSILEVKVSTESGQSLVRESLFSSIGMRTWDDWKELGRTSECFVKFNSLHVEALKTKQFRLYNEKKAMLIDDSLTRWMFKRLSREWIRVKFLHGIRWNLTSIIRDSGIEDERLGRSKARVEKTFNDLKDQRVIFSWEIEEEIKANTKGRPKIVDIRYLVKPDIVFEKEMKRFNQLHRDSEVNLIP
jgi:hypothetical protein